MDLISTANLAAAFSGQAPSPTAQAPSMLAATTADEIFKSMGNSADNASEMSPTLIAAIVGGIVLFVVVVALINRRANRPAMQKSAANTAKLNRQLMKAAGLKSRELKQLKLLAAQEKIDNPLVLLLCPSVLKDAAAKRQNARAA